MIAFPVPALAALPSSLTYRPTDVADRILEKAGLFTFGSLLRLVAPTTYDALKDKSPYQCYIALLRHIESNLFPVYWADEDWLEMCGMDGEDPISVLDREGITIQLMGIDPWYDGPNNIQSPAEAVCLGFRTHEHDLNGELSPDSFHCLDEVRAVLAFPNPMPIATTESIKPPRGRKWIEPWDKLRDLYAYCHAATGSIFLDNAISAHYQGAENPPWDIDEIRGLARDWKDAKPIAERIWAMRDWLDKLPLDRVPLMVRVLMRDRAALREVTYPVQRAPRAKTLCDVFARE